MKVSEIMSKEVIAVEAETPVNEIAKKLIKHDITGMPVVEGDEVIGIVTEDDVIMQEAKLHIPSYVNVLSSFLYLEDPDDVEADLKKILATSAKDLMTEQVVTISPDASIEDLATLFKEQDVNPVPVEEDGKLVGIVSRADVVALLARD